MKHIKKSCIHIVLLCLFFTAAWHEFEQRWPHGEWILQNDSGSYINMGYHLWKNGVLSTEKVDSLDAPPSAYRLPIYPLILAFCFGLTISPGDSIESSKDLLPGFRLCAKLQAVLLIATAFLTMAISWQVTKSMVAAYITLFLAGLDNTMWVMSNWIMPELFAVFMLSVFCYCFFLLTTRIGVGIAITGGCALAILSLTRGHFEYFIPVAAIWLYWSNRKISKLQLRHWGFLCLFICIPLISVQTWKTRNLMQLGRFYLSDRGGLALDVRADYNQMTFKEYLAFFPYFLARNKGPNFLMHIDSRHYVRLDRNPENSESIFRRTRKRRIELLSTYGGNMPVADKIQFQEALNKIKAHPIRHLLTTLPFGFRGMFAKKGLRGPFLFTMFLALFIFAVFKGKAPLVGFMLPSIFSYFFFSFLTNSEPRYNMPLIPILYVSLTTSGVAFVRAVGYHLKRYMAKGVLSRRILADSDGIRINYIK